MIDKLIMLSIVISWIAVLPTIYAASNFSPLGIIYEDLRIEQDAITLKWRTEESCSTLYELQGYSLASDLSYDFVSEPSNVIRIMNSNTAKIPYDDLFSESGDPLIYRLVALFDNGTVCSDQETRTRFYRFDESQFLETRVLAPNSTVCYDIPSTSFCPFSVFILPKTTAQQSCFCPVLNSSVGGRVFLSCTMSSECEPAVHLQFVRNGSICFSTSRNNTVIHFECNLDPCDESNCFVSIFLASHMVIIIGPPSAPNINFNGSYLHISAFSHTEFPVEYFDVEVTDITGIPTALTGRHNATSMGTLRLPIISDPTPNVCLPTRVTVSATNAIGKNTSTTAGVGNETDCYCYLKRENIIVVVIEESTNSAILSLSCGQNETTLQFMLENPNEQLQPITLICGREKTIPDLTANTGYVLYRRYTDQVLCRVKNFTTNMKSTSERTLITVILLVVVTAFILVILLFFFLVLKKRGSHKMIIHQI